MLRRARRRRGIGATSTGTAGSSGPAAIASARRLDQRRRLADARRARRRAAVPAARTGAVARRGFGLRLRRAPPTGVGGGGISVIVACSGAVSGGAGDSAGHNENARCTASDAASAIAKPRRVRPSRAAVRRAAADVPGSRGRATVRVGGDRHVGVARRRGWRALRSVALGIDLALNAHPPSGDDEAALAERADGGRQQRDARPRARARRASPRRRRRAPATAPCATIGPVVDVRRSRNARCSRGCARRRRARGDACAVPDTPAAATDGC